MPRQSMPVFYALKDTNIKNLKCLKNKTIHNVVTQRDGSQIVTFSTKSNFSNPYMNTIYSNDMDGQKYKMRVHFIEPKKFIEVLPSASLKAGDVIAKYTDANQIIKKLGEKYPRTRFFVEPLFIGDMKEAVGNWKYQEKVIIGWKANCSIPNTKTVERSLKACNSQSLTLQKVGGKEIPSSITNMKNIEYQASSKVGDKDYMMIGYKICKYSGTACPQKVTVFRSNPMVAEVKTVGGLCGK